MPQNFQYIILKEKSLILEYYSGKFQIDELINCKKVIAKDRDYSPGFNVIHEIRNLDFLFEISEVTKYVKLLSEDKKYLGERKSAMVTQTPDQVIISMGFEMLKKNLPITFKVCSTIEAACVFIGFSQNEFEMIQSLFENFQDDKS